MRIRLRRDGIPVVLLVAGALASCEGAPAADPGPVTTRDSAGIRIVEPTEPVWQEGEGWRLSAEPLVHVGAGDESAEQLYRVSDAARLSDGRVAVLNSGTSEVRLFGPDSGSLGTMGREGQGPGELRFPWRLQRRPGDTLIVWEWREPPSVFAPGGAYVEELPFAWDSLRSIPAGTHFATVYEPLPDGRLVLFVAEGVSRSQQRLPEEWFAPHRSVTGFFLTDRRASEVDTLGWYADGLGRWVESKPRPISVTALFSPKARITSGGDPLRIYAADSEAPRVHAFDGGGVLLFLLDLPIEPVTISEAHVEAERARREDALRQMDWPEEQRRQHLRALEQAPPQKTFPYFDYLMADSGGRLWVEEYPRPGLERPRWWVFGRDGTWLGTVRFPRDLEVFEIGADYVLGKWRDELDVEHVLLYGLVKPSTARGPPRGGSAGEPAAEFGDPEL